MPFFILMMAIVTAVREIRFETDMERQRRLVRLHQRRNGYRPCGSYDR